MGVVYKALDPLIGRTVAIKTIMASELAGEDELLARLRSEAKSAGRLTHPNIVTVFEFGEEAGMTYLVMEYVEGANLANVISSGTRIPLNSKLDIIIQIADGIGYAHDLGVTHRDIKPSNICLTRRGDPKILDFGLARFDSTKLTKTGHTSGTLMYMSPERMRGESGPSDDIFALGAVAYEIITGTRAFPGKGFTETVRNIHSGEYPIPPSKVVDVPTDLDAVIAKATAIDKNRRYATAADFARAVRDVQQSATFQRRAILDTTNLQDSIQMAAISFGSQNPYTAPDLVPTGNRQPGLDAPSQTGFASDATMIRPDTSSAKTEQHVTQGAKTVQHVADAAKTEQHGVQPAKTQNVRVPPTQASLAADQATVKIAQPQWTADPAASKPTEQMTAPRLPTRKTTAADGAAFLPTERFEAPDLADRREGQSFLEKTRTVVARAIRSVRSGPTAKPELAAKSVPTTGTTHPIAPSAGGKVDSGKASADTMPRPRVAKSPLQKAMLYGSATALTIAVAASGTASGSGPVALLCVYAGAVAAWFFVLRNCGRIGGVQAAAIGLAVTVGALVQGGVEGPRLATELAAGRAVAAQAAEMPPGVPPFASLLFAGWAAVGGLTILRAALGAVAILVAGWLLWDRERPQRAIGVMTFPLLLIEGIVFARIEAVASMLLVGAVVATVRRRYGIAAFLGIFAAGTSATAIAALPVLYGAAWYMIVFLSSAAVTLVVPKIVWPASTAWSASLATLAATSPVLMFLNSRVASLLTEWGVIDVMNAVSNAITARAGTAPRPVAAAMVATFILIVALFVAVSVIAARAPGLEAAMANGVALLLVLCMVREPAAWLLVAPFAILGNRILWIFAAVASPILLLAPDDPKTALIVWAISLAVPFGAYIAVRMVKGGAASPEAGPAVVSY
jgi:serine/threonine protein kinase